MLPTFVIGLREGLEAALIVGIIAAFLTANDRRDALRPMWAGVGLAVVLCAGVGVALRLVDEQLPHRGQEGLETVVGLVAVAMVSWMIIWMRSHAHELKGRLQHEAAGALGRGSMFALVAMAFVAVLREGFETAVFLLAAFQDSSDPKAAGVGAVLGIAVAVALGWGIYRGGVRIDLGRFFKVTGVVLVLVAAGLVASAIHTGAEAGWITAGQQKLLDLDWLVAPGTVRASLLTGMLGFQAEPTRLEVAAWLLYAVPMLAFVLAPNRVRAPLRATAAGVAAVAVPVVFLIGLLGGGAPGEPQDTASAATTRTVAVGITDAGCPQSLRVASGPTTFVVTGHGSRVTELEIASGGRILGEAENLSDGITGRISLTLAPGRYELACAGGRSGTLEVTGRAVASALPPAVAAGVRGYREYLERQTGLLVRRTALFTAALERGDGAQARRLFAWTRAPYERIEPVAESFGDLDPEIDARVNDVEKGRPWTGFHAIERRLWVGRTTAGTAPLARKLRTDVARLQRLVRTVKLEPAQIANGATELLGEVSKSKVTGEEDRYSHTDLVDFAANVAGARAAFDAIRPALEGKRPQLAATIDSRFRVVDAALARYARGGGYVSYDRLTRAQVRRLSDVIDALAEPLSRAPASALG
ncbi:MAG TPA: iron uptake system protein EfeO [Solirubrobacteraceae bacterium]|jgi:high-affinity iron transporter